MANLDREVLAIERQLKAGTYRPGTYREILVREPKVRTVSAAPVRDRVVHQALCHEIAPVFERGFIAHSFANRVGFGTHRAVDTFQRLLRRSRWSVRCDIFRYFPAIDHAILKRDIRRRIGCPRTLALIDAIIDGSNPQEPVVAYFPGDDLFTPHERRRGLPIGNLTSQLFANVYLDPLDHFVTERLSVPFVRYLDDFACFVDSQRDADAVRIAIERFLQGRRLLLHPDKTFVASCDEAHRFCGYELARKGRRLPTSSVERMRRHARSVYDRLRQGTLSPMEARARVDAMAAHAAHGGGARLARQLSRPVRRALHRGAFG